MTNRSASSWLRRRRVRCACGSFMNQVHHLPKSGERMDFPGRVPLISRRARLLHVHFLRANRCTWAAHVCATIPARGCLFSARIGCTCAHTCGTFGLFPHSEERNSRAAPYVHCRSFTRVHQNGALNWLDVSHRPPNTEPEIFFFPAIVQHILTRFSVPLRRRTTTRKT